MELGFPREPTIAAYLKTGKNEAAAANLLLESQDFAQRNRIIIYYELIPFRLKLCSVKPKLGIIIVVNKTVMTQIVTKVPSHLADSDISSRNTISILVLVLVTNQIVKTVSDNTKSALNCFLLLVNHHIDSIQSGWMNSKFLLKFRKLN